MSIESKISNDQLNIKDLALSREGIRELPFNFETDISQAAKDRIAGNLAETSGWDLTEELSKAALLDKSFLTPKLAEKAWNFTIPMLQKFESDHAKYKGKDDQFIKNFIRFAVRIIATFPDKAQELKLKERIERMDPTWYEKYWVKHGLKRFNAEARPHQMFMENALALAIFAPEQWEKYNQDQTKWQEESLRLKVDQDRSADWYYARQLAVDKFLFPEKVNQISITLEKWNKIKKSVDSQVQIKDIVVDEITWTALSMKILAAKRIDVSEKGIVFRTDDTELQGSLTSLPEIKKF